jgi:hypothetical protein
MNQKFLIYITYLINNLVYEIWNKLNEKITINNNNILL